MEQLRDRTALVTGASGGLGSELARALAREGMSVGLCGRREDVLTALAAELRSTGVRAEMLSADLTDMRQVHSLIERAEAALGPVDVLVNNAGTGSTAAFPNVTRQELTETVAVNLTAPLFLTHGVVPGMLERGRGHVVFISSTAGKMGSPYNGAYGATKAALIGLTKSLRAEYLDSPIEFSVICPGFIAGDGMYQKMVDEGFRSNRAMGETTLGSVVAKTVRAIKTNPPQVVDAGAPLRPIVALAEFAPRLVERNAARAGVTEFFRRVAAARGRV